MKIKFSVKTKCKHCHASNSLDIFQEMEDASDVMSVFRNPILFKCGSCKHGMMLSSSGMYTVSDSVYEKMLVHSTKRGNRTTHEECDDVITDHKVEKMISALNECNDVLDFIGRG